MAKICNKCGKENPENLIFCENCGAEINESDKANLDWLIFRKISGCNGHDVRFP